MLSKATEAYWENSVRAKFMEFPTPFLTKKELDLLEFISQQSMLRALQNNTTAIYEVANVILHFVNYFKKQQKHLPCALQHFCLWMQLFMKNTPLTPWEYNIILLLFLQCKWFIMEDNIPSPGEQENEFIYGKRIENMIDFSRQIKRLKKISGALKLNNSELKKVMQVTHPTLYNDLQNAYREGKAILKNPASVRALNSVMTATRISDNHEEFAITGTHYGRIHRNSEGLIRGFTKNGGVKSVQPVYSEGENTLFHSHPSQSPISRNDSSSPNFKVAGDIGHSYYAKKNIFAINNDGDIFYTNPKLAESCINSYNCGDADVGQIYLGNIREYMK